MISNKVLRLDSPVVVNAYLGISGNAMSIHPEIYYSYDGSNWLGDWSGTIQAISTGSNLYQWAVSFASVTSTNSSGFYVLRTFKVDTRTSTPNLTFYFGTNTPSHLSLPVATSASGNAYLAANQTFTGTNRFTGSIAVESNIGFTNNVLAPVSGDGSVLTNYSINCLIAERTINATNITAITNVVNGVDGTEYFCGITITNYTGSNNVLTFPSSWKWLGYGTNNPPTTSISGKIGRLSLMVNGTRVIAGYASEQ